MDRPVYGTTLSAATQLSPPGYVLVTLKHTTGPDMHTGSSYAPCATLFKFLFLMCTCTFVCVGGGVGGGVTV